MVCPPPSSSACAAGADAPTALSASSLDQHGQQHRKRHGRLGPRCRPVGLPCPPRAPSAISRPGRPARCHPAVSSPACPATAGRPDGARACGHLGQRLVALRAAVGKHTSVEGLRAPFTALSAYSEGRLSNSLITADMRMVGVAAAGGHPGATSGSPLGRSSSSAAWSLLRCVRLWRGPQHGRTALQAPLLCLARPCAPQSGARQSHRP
jgi:hypothetical protein